ncbi:chloramphenicol phosphotransferase CPT family protein [Saccharothrix sp. ST-888]|uniref:chloramphenicol phosphotransferase CPT family protein n=1 Tax=Saccharothrix sp. ST-888 TaxID=1427391 RepID=UPI001E5573AD|nr:chloramphenicol phosphotransferase CPT family protein [Saccharothrix sp. ST-888]
MATSADDDRPGGLIIFLNGTSSSGKSSIAGELLTILDEPYFHLPVDTFHAMRARREFPADRLPHILEQLRGARTAGR